MNDSMIISCTQCGTAVHVGLECVVCGAFAAPVGPAPEAPPPVDWRRMAPSWWLMATAMVPLLAMVALRLLGAVLRQEKVVYYGIYGPDEMGWGFSRQALGLTPDLVWLVGVILVVLVGGLAAGAGRSSRSAYAAAVVVAVPAMGAWWVEKVMSGVFGTPARLQPLQFGQVAKSKPWISLTAGSSWVVYIATLFVIGLVMGLIAWAISGRPGATAMGLGAALISLAFGVLGALIPSSSPEMIPTNVASGSRAQMASAVPGASNADPFLLLAGSVLVPTILVAALAVVCWKVWVKVPVTTAPAWPAMTTGMGGPASLPVAHGAAAGPPVTPLYSAGSGYSPVVPAAPAPPPGPPPGPMPSSAPTSRATPSDPSRGSSSPGLRSTMGRPKR